MCRRTLSITIAASLLSVANAQQQGNVLAFARFVNAEKSGREVVVPIVPGRTHEVDIDSSLRVKWDLEQLLDFALRAREGSKSSDTLLERLATLKTGLELYLEGESRHLALQEEAVEFALMERSSSKSVAIAGALNMAFRRLAEFQQQAKAKIAEHRQADPVLAAELHKDIEEVAQIEPDLQPMAETLSDALLEAEARLASKAARAQNLYVKMWARIEPRVGPPRQLHLEGFDTKEDAQPTVATRFGRIMDSRTRLELDAAQGLVDLVRRYRTERLDGQMSKALARAKETAISLKQELNIDLVNNRIDLLLETLRTAPRKEFDEVTKELQEIKSLFSPFSALASIQASTEVESLVKLVLLLERLSKNLNKNITTLPARLTGFLPKLAAIVRAQPDALGQDVLTILTGCQQKMAEDESYQRYRAWAEQISGLQSSLGLVAQVALVATDLVPRQLSDLATEDALNTNLDLMRAGGERRAGDEIVVEASVSLKEGDSETEIASGTQRFRVEMYGLHSESRGGLIFVDPRGEAPGVARWEPTPALAYQFRYGMRNNPTWNRLLAPSLGLSFSMLNFNADKQFELGVAANLTLFRDVLWLGYGRNIQARADYFYIGLNPLAATSWFRR